MIKLLFTSPRDWDLRWKKGELVIHFSPLRTKGDLFSRRRHLAFVSRMILFSGIGEGRSSHLLLSTEFFEACGVVFSD